MEFTRNNSQEKELKQLTNLLSLIQKERHKIKLNCYNWKKPFN